MPTAETTVASSTRRHAAVKAHRLLVDLFLVGVAAQFFLAGLGVWRAKPHGTQRFTSSTAFAPHRTLGNLLIILALVILVTAMLAATQRRQSVALLVLTAPQGAWTAVGASAPAVAALHVLGAFAIAILAYTMHRDGRPRTDSPRAASRSLGERAARQKRP